MQTEASPQDEPVTDSPLDFKLFIDLIYMECFVPILKVRLCKVITPPAVGEAES